MKEKVCHFDMLFLLFKKIKKSTILVDTKIFM